MSKWPVRTVQTPVVTVGRLTIDRIDPQGSLGALGVAEGDGEGEVEGAGDVCPRATPLIAATLQARQAVAMSRA
jgi:hypothetical protein